MNTVCLNQCTSYDPEFLDQVIETQCRVLHADALVKPGCTVMIKPNLVMKRKPDDATTTHPAVVAAVVRAVKRRGAGRIVIAESPGGPYTAGALKGIYQASGFTEMAEKEGAELNFDTSYVMVEANDYQKVSAFPFIRPAIEADVMINVAKLKSHCMTGMTGAAKNLFGLVPGLMKPEFHCRFPEKEDFCSMLVDLAVLAKPALSFIDGIICMEGDGPSGGSPRRGNVLLAGTNPFAVDAAAARLMAMEPHTIPMLRQAAERGLVSLKQEEITVEGDALEPLIMRDFRQPRSKTTDFMDHVPAFARPLAKKITTPRPAIRTKLCVGCGKCQESCPQHTIRIQNGKASIEYKNCIKCFCCHEMCPVRAIRIRRFSLFDL